jgi:transcriptional regulator with XRE-family HTH domain
MTTTSDPAAYFGRQVRKERTARGWNLHEFGQLIAYHPAAISRVENGKRPPTESFADQCDRVFSERGGWFHEFYEESRGWLALPAWLRDWASHEQSTRILRDWCPSIVTGLLQTEDYAREVSATTPVVADDEVSARVAARMARQQRVLMREDDPPATWFLLDYFALVRKVGTPEVMMTQMRHLAAVAGLPHVTIQVIPGGAHAGLLGGFTVTDHAAYAESVMRGQVFEDEQTVTDLSLRFDTLRGSACSAPHSISLIEQAADLWTGVSRATARRTATAPRQQPQPGASWSATPKTATA